MLHKFTCALRRHVDMRPAFFSLRKSNRRNAEKITFHRRAHGARVNRVVTHVGAIVDTGHHQIGPVTQQTRQRNVYAVSRRAVDVAKTIRSGLHVHRRVQRERI